MIFLPSHLSYVAIVICLSFQYTSKRILLCPHYRWESEDLVFLAMYSLRLIGKNLDGYFMCLVLRISLINCLEYTILESMTRRFLRQWQSK